jgi:hypothetical protein
MARCSSSHGARRHCNSCIYSRKHCHNLVRKICPAALASFFAFSCTIS